MQQFYTNTIESKFIKQLIATTNLPTVDTLYKGKLLVPGCYYVTDNYLVRAKSDSKDTVFEYDPEKFNQQLDIIHPYNFGQNYPGFTSTYRSINDGYDSKTHYYLGEYLRCIRDLHNIDLMPFYNCYTNDYVTDIFIGTATASDTETASDKLVIKQSNPNIYGKKVIAVPVKFGTTYSIFVDCGTQVQVITGLYGNKGLIKLTDKKITSNPNSSSDNEDNGAVYSYTSFRDGFTYTTPYPDSTTYPYTRFLKLFIQLPLNVDSSIVILEGDYTLKTKPLSVHASVPDSIFLKTRSVNSLISELSLTQISSSRSYAFSNRLIEYLVYNVITQDETINKNIERIQTYASSLTNAQLNFTPAFDMKDSTKDVWDDKLREYLYNLTLASNYITNKFDITGYVDKDVEQVITRGQKV